jgi:hypothetical protein
MEMRDFVRAGEKSTADFASRGIALRVKDPGAAVRGFTREGKFGAGTIEFGPPFDELINVLRAFFDEKRHGLGAAETVSSAERVLFMETDFVFVAECYRDAALRPGGGRVTEIGFGEDEDAAGAAEFNGGAQTSDARTYHGVISLVGLGRRGHRTFSCGRIRTKVSTASFRFCETIPRKRFCSQGFIKQTLKPETLSMVGTILESRKGARRGTRCAVC